MLTLGTETLFLLASTLLLIFLYLLGERFNLHVQRGWYVIITSFFLLWFGALIEFLDNFNVGWTLWAASSWMQIWGKNLLGHGLSSFLLLLGLALWAPAVVASREKYLLRIKTSERRYRLLTENASDMLAEHDLEGRFLFVTPASIPLIGYMPEALEGKSIYEFIDPDQLQLLQEKHREILESEDTISVRYRFRHKSGHYVWLESATRIYLTGQEGAPDAKRILAVSRDITDQVSSEENLISLNRDLEEQQRRVRLLYELSSSRNLTTADQLQATLTAGLNTLNMQLGIISQIKDEEYKVLHFAPQGSGLEKGQIFNLGETYCSIALMAKDIVAIEAMGQSDFASHPCYAAFKLEAYIGVPIQVNNEPFGTLNFSSPHVRDAKFSEADYDFVRLMGQWVSRVLEQEMATSQLLQSEEKFRAVVRSAAVGVITMNTRGIVESFNESASNIFGYEKEEVVGENVIMLMDRPDSEHHDQYLMDHINQGRDLQSGVSREIRGRRKDGGLIYLDLSVNEVKTETSHFFTGMVRDITQQKLAADALANAHLQLQSVFNSATQVAILATDEQGRITIFNPGAERMLGYTAEEVLGQSIDMFHLASEVEQRGLELSRELGREIKDFEVFVALAKLGGFSEKEWTYVRKDGSQLIVDSAVTAMYDTTGYITGYLEISLDISQRKRAEEALKLAKSVAEAANQTKSEFLANMSHELRTPLNSVIGFSNILLRSLTEKDDPKQKTYLERILANGQHLLELINDILDLSKVEAGGMDLEIVKIQVSTLINDMVEQLESQVANKHIALQAELPDNLIEIKTDPGKLKQILLNLLSNAIKFTDRGSVTIRVSADPETGRPHMIQVADTGIGIPADRIDHIFEEFEQVDSTTQRKYGGTGLGLSISKALCELMGYSLSVESEVGQGSVFTITIPPDDVEVQDDTQIRQDSRTTRRSLQGPSFHDLEEKQILIIDDDQDSQTLLIHYLKDFNCKIHTAGNVKDALKWVEQSPPDLITLDLQLPDQNGEIFIQELSKLKIEPAIPIVVVSVTAREYRGKLTGVTDFIQKPVNQNDFLWAVRRNFHQTSCCALLVEDDPDMRTLIAGYMADLHLELRTAGNGEEALEILQSFSPNLILLDLRMPVMNGLEFIEALREHKFERQPEIIVITGKDIKPQEELSLSSDNILVIPKDPSFETELRRILSKHFSAKGE